MRIATEETVLDVSGLTNGRAFSIKASGTAFKILSSGLYSDKIGAVLRELGCNAADAHIAAGCRELPFEVKLPTLLDPHFHVQDWGPGLSDEDVVELYTTYFSSSKSLSNDFTGAFGLGSKSPFAYIDQFSLTSVHDDVARSYIAYIGKDGTPQISQVGEEPARADWPHGVRVSFPILAKDVTEFENTATRLFRWFNPMPRVLGTHKLATLPVPLQDGPGYRIYACTSHYDRQRVDNLAAGIYVLMGNVCYPVDLEQAQLNERYTSLGGALFVIEAQIGDVSVSASREGLQYDETTRAQLSSLIEKAACRVLDPVLEAARKGTYKAFAKAAKLLSLIHI